MSPTDTHENAVAGWGFGVDEFNSNYINAFRSHYAPGYFTDCTAEVTVNFNGLQGRNNNWTMWKWGKPISTARPTNEMGNISYKKNSSTAPTNTCGRVFPADTSPTPGPSPTQWYYGGLEHASQNLANSNRNYPGFNWKNPDAPNHWTEADLCSGIGLTDGTNIPDGSNMITGGVEGLSTRKNRHVHCFNGRIEDISNITEENYFDFDELCMDHSVCDTSNDQIGAYFINEGIFWDGTHIISELNG